MTPTGPVRPPFRDNARLVLAATLGAVVLLAGVQALVRKSRDFSPDFLASVLLYGITVLNLALLLVLLFVLGRNLVRVLMERRRGVLGARLRMRLLLVLLLMAVGPSVLLVLIGSDLIQQTVDRWFNVDVDRMVSSSQALGHALRESVADRTRIHARLVARELAARNLIEAGAPLRRVVEARSRELGLDMVNVFDANGERVAVVDPRLPMVSRDDASAATLAEVAAEGREAEATAPLADGELLRVAVPVYRESSVQGVVVVASFFSGAVAGELREVEDRYVKFRKAATFKGPIKAVYLALYLFQALLIVFGAVWVSLYLSRRITTPLRLVAVAAERIAAGERGVRVDFASGDDAFAALIASFNNMSTRLARSEEEVEYSRAGLSRKNEELEERRRLMETVLETVGTGVVVTDAEGTVTSVNAAAGRLLGLEAAVGKPLADVLSGSGRSEIVTLARRVLSGRTDRQEREVEVPSGGRERSLAVTVVALPRSPGAAPGAVLVVDDLTPLLRAQKVAAWGEVAKKLAHEIKNPLTPIQLSAQRVRKAYLRSAPDFERVLTECTEAIVQEVEALKNLVDEFAQFARLPGARLVPASLHDIVEQTLPLYDGLYAGVTFERRFSTDVPTVKVDPDQMKRVLINLVDNAIEAMDRKGKVAIFTEFDRAQSRVRLGVADDGPGIAPEDRERLFVPHFSTKKRGSGLGLAIVHRIVQDHQGVIRVEDNTPRGARFIVEIPA